MKQGISGRAKKTSLMEEAGAALFASNLLACALVDNGYVLEATPRLRIMLGLRAQGADRLVDYVADKHREQVEAALSAQPGGSVTTLHCRMRTSRGGDFPAELQSTAIARKRGTCVLIAVTDLTAQIDAQNRLRTAAHFDELTGLPNRVLFHDRISSALAMAAREKRLLGLLVVDLDGFKAINDRYGHAIGDAVLREVGGRFAKYARRSDTLARLGGDEFVALLPKIRGREDAGLFAARLVNSLRDPITFDGGRVTLGASVGIAIYPDDGGDMASLFAQADAAMYVSKQSGTNQFNYADASANIVRNALPGSWSEDFRFGVSVMDDEHEKLFGMMTKLRELIASGTDRARIGDELQDILAFAKYHFQCEEKIMQSVGFGGYELHRVEHQRLVASLAELQEHSHLVGATITVRVLQDWLAHHIRNYDRAAARAVLAAAQ